MVLEAVLPWATAMLAGDALSVKPAGWETITLSDADSMVDPLVAVMGMV
jgi:hypothetical protein